MAAEQNVERGNWNSKLGFVLAAAGSAVGLGNIWRFPGEVAEGGGAAFIIVYLVCCFLVGFPVMAAELTIGRATGKNPVGAFKALSKSKFFPFVGFWGVLCGFMILSFYTVVAGWTLSFFFEEIFYFIGNEQLVNYFSQLDNGLKNAIFSSLFMIATIQIITGGVSDGIERVTKVLMPFLLVILIIMIGYVITLDGAEKGLELYLKPDFSKVTTDVMFDAMGQAFFSLSLGMGALITYGSYLDRKSDIPQAAAYVTLADISVAVIAGLLIIPAMFVAEASGIAIFAESGALKSSTTLVFDVLPQLFHTMSPIVGLLFGGTFFLLLSMAALTSTISLLEVPVSYVIDERGWRRKSAAWALGGTILAISLIISFDIGLIDFIDTIFSTVGLPLGGLLIALFVGYVWTTNNALMEMEDGTENFDKSFFYKFWPYFIKYISPILIGIVFIRTIMELF